MPNPDVLGEKLREVILAVVGTTHPAWDSIDDVPVDDLLREITAVVREYSRQPFLELTGPFIVQDKEIQGRYIINIAAVIHEIEFLQRSVVIDTLTDKIRPSNSVQEYLEFMEDGRQVARTQIPDGNEEMEVSTVFLGQTQTSWVEPGFGHVYFETAVRNHPLVDDPEIYIIEKRYATLDDAKEGQQQVVGKIVGIRDERRVALLDLLRKKAWHDHMVEKSQQEMEEGLFD